MKNENIKTGKQKAITIEAIVNADLDKAWEFFTEPRHIINWCMASDDWHAPYAENDLKTGGKFKTRMEAKNGSFGFDFEGIYSNVKKPETIEYDLEDGRHIIIKFTELGNGIKIEETFDPETENTLEKQRDGWQAILDNYKKYLESV